MRPDLVQRGPHREPENAIRRHGGYEGTNPRCCFSSPVLQTLGGRHFRVDDDVLDVEDDDVDAVGDDHDADVAEDDDGLDDNDADDVDVDNDVDDVDLRMAASWARECGMSAPG